MAGLCKNREEIGVPPRMTTRDDVEQRESSLEAYYDAASSKYWIQDVRGDWLKITLSQLRPHLKAAGYRHKAAPDQNVSPLDEKITQIHTEANVDFSGPLAGWTKGCHEISGKRILVTSSPRPPIPKRGECPIIHQWFQGMFGSEQSVFVHAWLRFAYLGIAQKTSRPGQILVVAGPHGCGKSLFQSLVVTQLLGGRSAKPFRYLMGKTEFNSDLFGAEHLVIEDEQSSTTPSDRRKFGAQLKGIVANKEHSHHPKGRDAMLLAPFWRCTMSLNSEPENLLVLPPLDEGLADKIMILNAQKFIWPIPTETWEQYNEFTKKISQELPAYLWWLLNKFKLPEKQRDERYGVATYHNPKLLDAINNLSPEQTLAELIDSDFFPRQQGASENLRMSANELYERMIKSPLGNEFRRVVTSPQTVGYYLARLKERNPSRYVQRKTRGRVIWDIAPPGGTQGGQ